MALASTQPLYEYQESSWGVKDNLDAICEPNI
jgi:hypothetical protein